MPPCVPSRADPSGLGHVATIYSSVQGPPGVETPTNCLFTDTCVTVFRRSDDSIAFKGVLEGQLYLVDFNKAELNTCLISKTNMGWLCHRRLAHVGMKNLHKLLKGEHRYMCYCL